MSMKDHPIHLHGHSFQVVAIGDGPVPEPFKDTLTLRRMDSYDVEFVAANPGRWLFDCHNLDHIMGGMMARFTTNKTAPPRTSLRADGDPERQDVRRRASVIVRAWDLVER